MNESKYADEKSDAGSYPDGLIGFRKSPDFYVFRRLCFLIESSIIPEQILFNARISEHNLVFGYTANTAHYAYSS